MKSMIASALLTGLVSVSSVSMADNEKGVPAGFDGFLVYMANGVYDPSVQSPQPGLENCEGLFCDGGYFQRDIMGRSEYQIQQKKQEAKDFFRTRFGLDVEDPALAGRIVFTSFMTRPNWDYRAYVMDSKTRAEGWKVRDGGYNVRVIDPAGIDLGGEFLGRHAPFNSVMFSGEYNILLKDRQEGEDKELVIEFRSATFHQINDDGSVMLRCELYNKELGSGYAIVTLDNIVRKDGLVQGRGRNVLTFPPFIQTNGTQVKQDVVESD